MAGIFGILEFWRFAAHKGFAYYSVELVLLANNNRHEVDSNTFLLSGKPIYPLRILPCPNSDLIWDKLVSVARAPLRTRAFSEPWWLAMEI
jgi:hypothetical protein